MLIDINTGNLIISNELIVGPKYSFEQFKKTKFYDNQDGIRIIVLNKEQVIDGRNYLISLFFREGIIYIVSLFCCDINFTEKDEPQRKKYHDMILKSYGLDTHNEYSWGKVYSEYDARGNVSDICILYY